MPKSYNLGSKSDMKKFQKDLQKNVMNSAMNMAQNTYSDVVCPHCSKLIKAKSGSNTCPYCRNTFTIRLDFN